MILIGVIRLLPLANICRRDEHTVGFQTLVLKELELLLSLYELTKRTLYTKLSKLNWSAVSWLFYPRYTFFFFLFLIATNVRAVNVTFQVDMSQMVVSPAGVYLAGDFQGWNPALNVMTDMGGGIFAITIDLPPGTYVFKYINGNTWGSDETVPASCGQDNGFGSYNRYITITEETTLPAICFGQCSLCEPASFVMNGDAAALGGDCYLITPGAEFQTGAFWSNTQVDLAYDFDFQFELNLGTSDADGADGVVFVLHRLGSSALGFTGGGIGYSSFGTSLGIEFDTWYNSEYNDPLEDHIAIELNGVVDHFTPQNIGLPVQMSALNANTEDGLDHIVSITWKASTQTLSVYFDCVLRIQTNYDLVNLVFGGESLVFWGFTGATGLFFNQQRICAVPTAMQTEVIDMCPGSSAQLNAGQSANGVYSWTPAAFLDNATIASPVASPPGSTIYQVSYLDLCNVTVNKQVTVNVLDSDVACFFLPVSLLDFSISPQEELVHFRWTCTEEKNSAFYEIEESSDGMRFTTLKRVNSMGQLEPEMHYSLTLRRVKQDRYYRLKHYDTAGRELFVSNHEFVSGYRKDVIEIRCNSYRDECYLSGELPAGFTSIEVLNALGARVAYSGFQHDVKSVSVDLPSESALYILVLRNECGHVIYSDRIIFSD